MFDGNPSSFARSAFRGAAGFTRPLRYPGAGVAAVVAGRAYPVRGWSLSGVQFELHPLAAGAFDDMPAPRFNRGDTLRIALRFEVMGETIEVPVAARVLRRGSNGVIARFALLSRATRRKFQRALDLQYAEGFLTSQGGAQRPAA